MYKTYKNENYIIRYKPNELSDSLIINGAINSLRWHAIGEPAFIETKGDSDDEIDWWVDNVCYTDVRLYCKACKFDEETTMFWLLKYGDELPRLSIMFNA